MRVPYSWLREIIRAGAPGWDVAPDELEQTLIRIGHEVEEVIPAGPVSGPLMIGRVAEIEELAEFEETDPGRQGGRRRIRTPRHRLRRNKLRGR